MVENEVEVAEDKGEEEDSVTRRNDVKTHSGENLLMISRRSQCMDSELEKLSGNHVT